MQSATHLGLCPPGVGILYQHISTPPSLTTLLNGCPLYRSPICYVKKFLLLLSFVVFQLVSILYQGFWRTPFYCLQTSGFACSIYFFLHISRFFYLGFQLPFSFWGILLLFADLSLLSFCLSFKFFAFSWRPLCAMSVSIDRSVLMPLIWFSILAFHFGCCRLLLFSFWDF